MLCESMPKSKARKRTKSTRPTRSFRTIHAEAEGGICADLFDDFLSMAKARGIEFCAPGDLLPQDTSAIPSGSIRSGVLPGREGWMALQNP